MLARLFKNQPRNWLILDLARRITSVMVDAK